MKRKGKILIFLIVSIFTLFLTSCAEERTINEIYNVSYTGTITIDGLEDAIQAVIKNSTDASIGIGNYAYSFGGVDLQSTGSGFIYKSYAVLKDGTEIDAKETIENADNVEEYRYLVLTNEHVIRDAYMIKVTFDDETVDASKDIYYDQEKDLAILQFTSKTYLPTLTLGDSEDLVAGTFVVAIGCPTGLNLADTATFGIISYVKRYIIEKIGIKKVTNEYIQHDAAVSPGSSGGPLLNLNGEVIGINSMKSADTDAEGIGFAIPVNVVKEFISKYEESIKTSTK